MMHSESSPTLRLERELTTPVDMCLADGRLNAAAVGWSRKPLHRANLRGWGRNKRFEYWCVVTPEFVVTANISHHDYRANLASVFIDLQTRETSGGRQNRWLPIRNPLSDRAPGLPMEACAKNIRVRLEPNAQGTLLHTEAPGLTVDLQVYEEPGHESMGVLVPWSDRLFQYTRKNNCLEVEGTVVVRGIQHSVRRGQAYAIHDHGRGRWPYDTRWNWAAASGDTGGHQIGLQFGARWTEGTPSTENALRIDGCLHKISEELRWSYDSSAWMKPWTIQGQQVDLVFTPVVHHRHCFNRWLITSRGDQCFGNFSGEIVSGTGERIRVERVFGMAEEVHRRW